MKDESTTRKRAARERLYTDALPVAENKLPAWRAPTGTNNEPSLSRLEEQFVQHWTRCYKLPYAAIEAGYPPARAMIIGRGLLHDDRIKRRIASIEHARLMRIQVDPDEWFRRLMFQASAVAFAELPFEIIIPPCRYCWGENHLYQRSYSEMEADLEFHNQRYIIYPDGVRRKARIGETQPPFDKMGGVGYDICEGPNENCPECKGRGLATKPVILYKDTRYMSPEQLAVIAGAKDTGRGGFQIEINDRQKARDLIIDVMMRYKDYQELPASSDASFGNMSIDQLKQLVATGEELGLDDEDDDDC